MMNCRVATRLMSEAQERPISLSENLSLRMHRMMCRGCRNFEKQMRLLRKASQAFNQGAGERLQNPKPEGDSRK
jgi:hypothetical protein